MSERERDRERERETSPLFTIKVVFVSEEFSLHVGSDVIR